MKNLTASDRKALIRLASTMDKGSPERRAILAGLNKVVSNLRAPVDDETLKAQLEFELYQFRSTYGEDEYSQQDVIESTIQALEEGHGRQDYRNLYGRALKMLKRMM